MLSEILNVLVIAMAVVIPVAYGVNYRRKNILAKQKLYDATERGIAEPLSLHPKIDPGSCISIGACVDACPEGDILGIINGRAHLVSPTRCIGHGACMTACPVGAISLVFGTETRGVELPHIKETFETNVEGLYIAGELGGMGLIRNAVRQGVEAVKNIAASNKGNQSGVTVLIIIGAGPAGMSAALEAKQRNMSAIILEQESDFGGAILSFPRQKLVMTQPMEIPTYGVFKKREVIKEDLLDLWRDIVNAADIDLKFLKRVESVVRENGHFVVKAGGEEFRATNVLLTIGRRGTPRKLGVSGEKSSKVAYKLLEPEQYMGKDLLVVGGGDSAVESALALSEQNNTRVTLSYRKSVFSRIKQKNEIRITEAIESGRIKTLMESQVVEITPSEVHISHRGGTLLIPNDFVIIQIGGELPTAFLKSIGIEMETKHGVR